MVKQVLELLSYPRVEPSLWVLAAQLGVGLSPSLPTRTIAVPPLQVSLVEVSEPVLMEATALLRKLSKPVPQVERAWLLSSHFSSKLNRVG